MFSAAYPEEFGSDHALKTRKVGVKVPNMRLPSYIKPVTSPDFQWITMLTLSTVTCSRYELINLSSLKNLGALLIGERFDTSDAGFDDRVIRAWSRAVTESGAFSVLRVLAIDKQVELTPAMFDYLQVFPTLALFLVNNCKLESRSKEAAELHGFTYRTASALSKLFFEGIKPDKHDHCPWYDILQAAFFSAGQYSVRHLTLEGVEAVNELPFLSFVLGEAPRNASLNPHGRSLRGFERLSDTALRRQRPHTKKRLLEREESQAGKVVLKQAKSNSGFRRPIRKPIVDGAWGDVMSSTSKLCAAPTAVFVHYLWFNKPLLAIFAPNPSF